MRERIPRFKSVGDTKDGLADLVVEVHRVLLCGLLVPVARRPSLDQVLTRTPSKDNTTLLMGLTNSKRLLKYSWGKLFSSV